MFTRLSFTKRRAAKGQIRPINVEGSLTTIEACEVSEARFSEPVDSEALLTLTEHPLGDPQGCADDELVIAAQNGVSSAVNELLTRHRNLLRGAVRRLTANADETEDVVQEAMLRAFVNIGRFRKEARFSSWLVAIGINSALSSRRRSGRAEWISLEETEEPLRRKQSRELRDTRPTPEQECLDRELHELVQQEIRKLPRPYRSVLLTRSLDESSIDESAHALGITDAAVKGRLWRARLMLSKALGIRGHRRIFPSRRTAGAEA
jgi:RNA polymerase sigma-70 factor (ECF subfamily)